MREPPNIAEERLRGCLREQYDLAVATLAFLPRGHDYNAGVYRVVSERGAGYLLKVSSRPLYEPSCLVPHFLRDQGISAAVAPVPTKGGALWTALDGWTVIVYPFLEGETSLTGMTDVLWKETGAIFRRIHQARLPEEGIPSPRRETFDPGVYVRWVRAFEDQHLRWLAGGSDASRALRAAWLAHRSAIHAALTSLESLAAALRSRPLPYVVCHADLHAANLLRDRAGRVFVLDWDEVMLAPKERDFIFIRGPAAVAFWDGYGERAVDWAALTYFRWERVLQDLVEEAQQACFRDDVGEDIKAEAARRFAATFLAGGNADAARAAAAHLSGDAGVRDTAER